MGLRLVAFSSGTSKSPCSDESRRISRNFRRLYRQAGASAHLAESLSFAAVATAARVARGELTASTAIWAASRAL